MKEQIEDVIFEHLKNIEAEQSAARERDREILGRIAQVETMVARIEIGG